MFNRPLNYHTPSVRNDRMILETMKSNDSTGCGLTGGEPLLVLDKVVHYLRLLKKNRGSKFWIHLYTNGDFLDHGAVKELKKAGLDEIRFDLAGIDYNLEKVIMARQYLPRVLLEIPVIPEDREKLLNLLPELGRVGIDCLNLHELVVNIHSLKRMKGRGYKAAQPAYKVPFYTRMNEAPIAGSLELILDVLDRAVKEDFSYGIHYCHYRARIIRQHLGKDLQVATRIRRPYEKVTGEGLLEKVVIPGSGLQQALEDLEKHRIEKVKVRIVPYRNRLETDLDYVDYLNPRQYEVAVVQSLPYGKFTDVDIRVL
ncbi:MAG: radical SAM protein [bacterium]